MVSINGVVRHQGILGSQRLVFGTADNWIHKETASITLHLRVRKLGITDVYNDLTQLLGCRFNYALTL